MHLPVCSSFVFLYYNVNLPYATTFMRVVDVIYFGTKLGVSKYVLIGCN